MLHPERQRRRVTCIDAECEQQRPYEGLQTHLYPALAQTDVETRAVDKQTVGEHNIKVSRATYGQHWRQVSTGEAKEGERLGCLPMTQCDNEC
jgi:hypothetical protein